MIRHRFVVLLLVMVAFLLAMPMIQLLSQNDSFAWANAVIAGLIAALLVSAIFAVSDRKTIRVMAIALAVPALAFRIITVVVSGAAFEMATYLFTIAFLGLVAAAILGTLFRPIKVTVETISASLCVYLLLVLLWAFSYAVIDLIVPGSFSYSLADSANMRVVGGDAVFPIYFSLVTITTLGYGDIVPALPFAQMMAALEAFVGQMYIAVLVARLVALHLVTSDDPAGERQSRM